MEKDTKEQKSTAEKMSCCLVELAEIIKSKNYFINDIHQEKTGEVSKFLKGIDTGTGNIIISVRPAFLEGISFLSDVYVRRFVCNRI